MRRDGIVLLGMEAMYDKLQFVDEPIGGDADRQAEACRTMDAQVRPLNNIAQEG